jgi:hypothetical protein
MIGDLLGLETRVPYLASILYVTLPSFTQFPLFHDQFLLPVVFVCAITLIIYAVQKKSFWLSTIAGISIYIATFISFSLLPLIGFAIVWLLMQWVSVRQSGSWLDIVKILAGIVVGVAFAGLVCHLLLDYNPIARYQAAFAQHRTIKYFRDGLAQVWQALLINNLEYLTLLGLPLVITVIYQTLVSFLRLIGKQENQMDLFVVAVSVIYLGLNVLGQTRGEVGRIWLFLAPAVCLVGAFGLSSVYRSGRVPIFLIVGTQLAIALFVFQFQDYGCKFCP